MKFFCRSPVLMKGFSLMQFLAGINQDTAFCSAFTKEVTISDIDKSISDAITNVDLF